MSKVKGFDKVKYFNPKDMRKLAHKHLTIFFKRVTKKGQDYKGTKFKKYSDSYTDLINKKFLKKDGSRLEGYKEAAIGVKTTDPNLVLRNKTMNNFDVRGADKDSYTLGWTSEAARIIDSLASAKPPRDVKKGVPSKEMDQVVKLLGKIVDKEWTKIPNVQVITS